MNCEDSITDTNGEHSSTDTNAEHSSTDTNGEHSSTAAVLSFVNAIIDRESQGENQTQMVNTAAQTLMLNTVYAAQAQMVSTAGQPQYWHLSMPSLCTSRFWVEKGVRKHRKNICIVLAGSYGPGLKPRLR